MFLGVRGSQLCLIAVNECSISVFHCGTAGTGSTKLEIITLKSLNVTEEVNSQLKRKHVIIKLLFIICIFTFYLIVTQLIIYLIMSLSYLGTFSSACSKNMSLWSHINNVCTNSSG